LSDLIILVSQSSDGARPLQWHSHRLTGCAGPHRFATFRSRLYPVAFARIETPITADRSERQFQMIIRANNFRAWFNANLREHVRDIVSHGADCGFPCITYTSDTVKIFDRFGDEIWNMAVEESESFGNKNVAEMIAGFARGDMLETLDTFKNLMVWYACEAIAREIAT